MHAAGPLARLTQLGEPTTADHYAAADALLAEVAGSFTIVEDPVTLATA